MKIALIGNPGSGKSTLGLKLHNLLGISLYHLDQYYWKPGWQRPDPTEFAEIHKQLCDKPEWIIEGCAIRLLEYRAKQADVIIFLDMPRYLCFYRTFKRAFTCFGREYFASAKECRERFPQWQLLKYMWYFNRDKKPEIERIIQKYKDEKKNFVIRNKDELDKLIKKFESKGI